MMRTTLTLDDDVAAKLEAEARRTGRSFRTVVNETLRLGLVRPARKASVPAFKVRATGLGLRSGLSYDNTEELLDLAEGPLRR